MPKITEVRDRELPVAIDPGSIASAERGGKGRGMNDRTYIEKMADSGMGVDLTDDRPKGEK